jgi:hypothetical protein
MKSPRNTAAVILVLLVLATVSSPAAGGNQSLNETDGNSSSGRMTGEFLSTFDYWATPTDMSQYNPDIEISTPKKPDEETIKDYPGMILLDNETAAELFAVEGEVIDNGNGTFTMIFYRDYDPGLCSSSETAPEGTGGAGAGTDSGSESSSSFTFLSGIAGIVFAGLIVAYSGKKKNE